MALTATSFMNSTSNSLKYLDSGAISRLNYQAQQDALSAQQSESHNNGGFLGGIGYLGEKIGLGAISGIEGIWDYSAGGIAKLFGADDWAEKRFANDWINYNDADEWYNPSNGWKVAGDVAGGIGTSLPSMAALVGVGLATGGAAVPAMVTTFLTAGLSSAGNATKEAYRQTGELGGKEFGYGALVGITEGAVETFSDAVLGGVGGQITKYFQGSIGASAVRQTFGKTLLNSFASEGFEEIIGEFADPFWKRMTYDPTADNATLQELAYAGIVGGLSGAIMSGFGGAISNGISIIKGNNAVSDGRASKIIKDAQYISDHDNQNQTELNSVDSVRDFLSDLQESLAKTNGNVETVNQRLLLGKLERANNAFVLQSLVVRSAEKNFFNAEQIVRSINEFGYTDANGNPINITAEQLREGIDTTNKRTFRRSITKALQNNSALRTLSVLDATGQLMIDAKKFERAMLLGKDIASQTDINRYIEQTNDNERRDAGERLGIRDWNIVTADELQSAIGEYIYNGGLNEYLTEQTDMQRMREIDPSTDLALPKKIRLNDGATVSYRIGNDRIAVTRRGDNYRIYNYQSDQYTKALTRTEFDSLVSEMHNEVSQGTKKAETNTNLEKSSENAEKSSAPSFTPQTAELDRLAAEKVPEYSKLSEPNKQAVRMTIRQAQAHGIDEAATLTFARVAARSGMNVVFDRGRAAVGDANIQGNTIYINPNAPKERLRNRLLLHEVGHALFRGKDGTKLIIDVLEHIAPERSQKTAQKYINFYEEQGMSAEQYMPIVIEEVATAHIEDVLGDANAWEYILGEEPSLSEKVLSFFRKAARDYSADEKLSAEARKLLRTYKKLFTELSAKNQGNNALELMQQDERTKKAAKEIADRKAYRYSIDADLLDFVDSVSAMESKSAISKRKHTLGKISEKHAKIVEDILSSELGLNIYAGGYTVNIDGSAVKHIEEKHGANGSSDHSMQSKADVARIGWAVNNADFGYIARTQTGEIDYSTQYRNADGSPSPKIILEKSIGGGKFIVAECVPDTTAEKIHIISARKTKSDNGQVLNVKSNDSPQPTSETLLDGITATDSITDFSENVNRNSENSSDERYALSESDADGDGIQGKLAYSYEALTKKDDLSVVKLPDEIPMSDGKIDRKAVIARGRLNARSQNNLSNTEDVTYVYIEDIKTDVLVRRDGLEHGLSRNDKNTALATMRIGDLLKNSVAVNELNGRTNGKRTTEMSYVLLAVGQNKNSPYLVRTIVDKTTNSISEISTYGLYAIKAKKEGALFLPKENKGNEAFSDENRLSPYLRSTVSIAQLFENVKGLPLASEIFSEDVAKKLGVSRSEGTLSGDIRFALPETIEKDVIDIYGNTYRWSETGYILKDGTRLDLSGRKDGAPGGYRTMDHRDIFADVSKDSGTDAMIKFMSRGNIRVNPEIPGISLQIEPTTKQYNQITDLVERIGWKEKTFSVDFDNQNGETVDTLNYEGNVSARKVVSDIRYYFKEGKVPNTSELAKFRYALPETDSTGRTLTPEQQNFFAESAIKAVKDDGSLRISPDGALMPVYHGTNNGEFYEFDKKLAGSSNDAGWYGKGFYFAFREGEAEYYGKRVLECYLNIKNPFVFDDEMQAYDGITSGDVLFDFASFVLNMAEKFPDIAKELTVDVAEHSYGDSSEVIKKNFVDLAAELKEIYDSERLSVVKVYDELSGDYYNYCMENDVKSMDIPADLKKIIQERHITCASWAEYLRKNGEITRQQYDDILDAMDKYGERNFDTVFLYARFETRRRAETHRLSAALQYLSEKKYSYLEQHIPEYYMTHIGNEFTEEIKHRGYDGVLQSLYGDEIVAFNANQIKLTSNTSPTGDSDMRYALPDTDSEGNTLSAGQREYFADSKVLDDNGNLLLVYHGTRKADFTEFRRNVNYFTDSAEMAGSYSPNGEKYTGYLNITNPYIIDAGGEKWSRIPINKETKQFLDEYGSSTFKEDGLWRTTPADIAAAIEEAVDEGEMDYDGIIIRNIDDTGSYYKTNENIVANDYITFRSNQFKNADNQKPTVDRDIRYAISDEFLDAIYDDNAEGTNSVQDKSFDAEAVVARGMPRSANKSRLTVGELRKIAKSTNQKVYSKREILSVVNKFTGISALTQKSRTEIADAVWQILNESPDVEYRRDVAHDMAEFIVAKIIVDAKTENPDARAAQETLSYLHTGIGKLSFSKEDMSEILHVRDKKGLQQILGRWGYKGARKVDGANSLVSGKRTPMDVFVVDIAREMPAMEYLEEMHPVDAFLEIDSVYERALSDAKDKWISAYWDMPDSEIPNMIKSVEDAIMQAYETEGTKSNFSRRMEHTAEYYSERAEYWKAECDKIKGRNRLLGLLMSKAQRMKDLKLGTFANSTQHDRQIFKSSIEKLSQIQFRGNLNVSGTRKIIADLRQWYTSDAVKTGILGYVDEKSPGLYVKGVADMLETLSEGKKGFTNNDLKILYDVMSYFTNFVENWGKVFRQGKWIEAKPEAERYICTLHSNEGLKVGMFNKLGGTTYMQTFGDPMAVARRMDMYENGFYTEMMQELRDATVDAQVKEMEMLTQYNEFNERHKKYVKKSSVDTVTYRGTEIPKLHLIGLYMTMKREQAWAGLAANGFAFTDAKGNSIRVNGVVSPDAKITAAELEQYTKDQLSEIEKLLTDTDREYIAILEQAYNVDARKLKADRDMQRLGFTNATNDYYYPIRRGNIAKNVDASDIADELDRVSNSSFNKDTVRGAKQELFIESADVVFNRHVHAVVQYAYLSPAVEAYNRLYNLDISGNKNKPVSVATESKNIWAKGNRYFVKLISDIQGIPASSSEGMKVLGAIRAGYAKFQLGANPKVWMTQLSSVFASSSLLDADCITRGMAMSSKSVDEYCSIAKLRNNDNTVAMAQGVLDSKAKRAVGKVNKFTDLLMVPIGKMDRFVVGRLFGACQVQVEKNGSAKIGTEANKVEAGKLLRRVILETQQNAFATERSAAMRSGNEIMRTITMFSADSMKVIGRVIDAVGEVSVLKAKLKATADVKTRSELKQRLKAANRKSRKAIGALALSAVFMASIAQLFRWFYDKERDDESVAKTMLVDAVGNLFGGLPLFKEAYSKIFEGYDVDNYAYSAINDLLDSAINLFDAAGNIFTGGGSIQERNRALRNLAYSVGQIFGIPVRNVYNVFFGLTKHLSRKVAYVIDSSFYKKNYRDDLHKAIEEDDAEMTSFIMSLIMGERMNENVDEAVFGELLTLTKNGQKVIPRSVPSSITIDNVEYPLSATEQAAIREAYATSGDSLKGLFAKPKYSMLSDEQKADAIGYIYDTYYDKAMENTLGIDRGNKSLIVADVVGVDNLALLYATTKGLTSDKDRSGNVISGSKRKKVIAAINSLGIGTEKKLLLICARGYSLQDYDIRGLQAKKAKMYLLRYILSLKGKTKAEKAEIAKLCGFETVNGRIITKNL